MEKIAVYGAGGFGKDIVFLLETINKTNRKYDIIGFFDDGLEKGGIICGYPVIGGYNDLNAFSEQINIVFAINGTGIIEKIVSKISKKDIKFPNILHPDSYIDINSLDIGVGNVFNINVIVSKDVKIGNFNSLNTRVALGHDVTIGNYNHFSPNVQISGGVLIGDNNSFGLNSSIIQYKKVGNRNKIGACSLVIRNVSDDKSVFGIPALINKF